MVPALGFGTRIPTDRAAPCRSELKVSPYDLPMMFRVGAAYDVDFSPKARVTLATELRHPNDNVEQGAVGAEFGYAEQFFLRGGYKFQYEEEGLTLGRRSQHDCLRRHQVDGGLFLAGFWPSPVDPAVFGRLHVLR